jgi:hypothetical protein
MRSTGKPEGVACLVTDFGDLLLNKNEEAVVLSILNGNKKSSRNRLERALLWSFVNHYMKDYWLREFAEGIL